MTRDAFKEVQPKVTTKRSEEEIRAEKDVQKRQKELTGRQYRIPHSLGRQQFDEPFNKIRVQSPKIGCQG